MRNYHFLNKERGNRSPCSSLRVSDSHSLIATCSDKPHVPLQASLANRSSRPTRVHSTTTSFSIVKLLQTLPPTPQLSHCFLSKIKNTWQWGPPPPLLYPRIKRRLLFRLSTTTRVLPLSLTEIPPSHIPPAGPTRFENFKIYLPMLMLLVVLLLY